MMLAESIAWRMEMTFGRDGTKDESELNKKMRKQVETATIRSTYNERSAIENCRQKWSGAARRKGGATW